MDGRAGTTTTRLGDPIFLLVGLCLVSLASFHFILIPAAEESGYYYFIAAVLWLYVISLTATTGINLYCRSLLIFPTSLQIGILFTTGYGIPLAVWGIYLLYRRAKPARQPAA